MEDLKEFTNMADQIEFNEVLSLVPFYSEFLTVDELYENAAQLVQRHPQTMKYSEIGHSGQGETIPMLEIGQGRRKALLYAFPHPNEPIGSLTVLAWAKILAEDEELCHRLNYTWYLIPCADPDGARLNEGWFKGDFSLERHVLNFYRRVGSLDIDWNFPVKYKKYQFKKPKLPESKAIQKILDLHKPDIIYPLHNNLFGGAYFFTTKRFDSVFYRQVMGMLHNLHISPHLGEPCEIWVEKYEGVFFGMPRKSQWYDYLEKTGVDPLKVLVGGTCSADYLTQIHPGAIGIIAEIPYFQTDKIANTSKAQKTRRKCYLAKLEDEKEVFQSIREGFERLGVQLNRQSPFYSLFTRYLEAKPSLIHSQYREINEAAQYSRPASIAEEFDLRVGNYFIETVARLAQFLRLLDDSQSVSQNSNLLKDIYNQIATQIRQRVQFIEKEGNFHIIPYSELVKLQLGVLLATVKYLERRER